MTLSALIFDVDGTLADTEELHREAFNRAFVDYRFDWEWSPADYRQLLAITGGKERLAHFIAALDVREDDRSLFQSYIGELHAAKTAHYIQRIRSHPVPLRAGVEPLLREARRMGLRLAIASTTTRRNIEALLSAALGPDATSWFEVITCGDDVPRKKPAPDIYLAALQLLRLPAGQCVAFEDSANGLASAKAAGIYTVITPTLLTEDEDFSGADWLLPDLTALNLTALADRVAARIAA